MNTSKVSHVVIGPRGHKMTIKQNLYQAIKEHMAIYGRENTIIMLHEVISKCQSEFDKKPGPEAS